MAEIGPFRGWRFTDKAGEIAELTSPLFELSDQQLLAAQYACPFNIIHLSLPSDPDSATHTIAQWKEEGIIRQDEQPSIYVYQQSFTGQDGTGKNIRGFICNIRLHEWDEQIVLRHEATMTHAVRERSEILNQTRMNICPTHGLYTDNDCLLEAFLEESLQQPVWEFEDMLGVRNTLSIISDLQIIRKFTEALRNKQVIIADGHHRYEASLLYRNALSLNPLESHPALYHPMYLTNTESNDLEIFPTHRLFHGLEHFHKDDFVNKLENYFLMKRIDDPQKLQDLMEKTGHSFGIIFPGTYYLATLKKGLEKAIQWNFPQIIRELDLTILHYFIIEKILGIEGKKQKNWKSINFSFKFTKIFSEVEAGKYQVAVLTRKISQEEIKRVCYSGYTLPQKSTYFFPKVLCGLVLSSLNPEEFFVENKLYIKDLNI